MEGEPPKADRFSERALAALNKDFVLIGKQRVHPFYGWLAIGLAAGIAMGVAFVANRSGRFEESGAAALPVDLTPVTTLAAETSINTSGGITFAGCEVSTVTNGQCVNNGNLKPSNISKLDLHTLIPNHPTTKIYLNYVPYWGQSNHPNVGYSSNNAAQAAKEVADIASRGFDGLISDWYGQGSWEDASTKLIQNEIDKQSKLTFSLMIDQGGIKWHSCYPTCSATQALLNTLTYARSQGYFSDPHYQRLGGAAIVHDFGLLAYPINWATIKAANPDLAWVFESQGAYTNANGIGAFGWPQPKTYNVEPAGYTGLDYLTNFYATSAKFPTKYVVGSVWKGFDDTVASWSTAPFNVAGVNGGRRIEQNCGQTWLATWNATNAYTGRLDAVEVATWSDYEEGTEVETGIDNCVGISANLTASTLNWGITGQQNTVHHFTVYISKDGQNLSVLQDQIPASQRSLALSNYGIPTGTYSLYVKAVGQPSMKNHMTTALTYSVSATTQQTTSCSANPCITSPAPGVAAASPVHFAASGKSSYPITAWAVYDDAAHGYALLGKWSGTSLDQYIAMKAGVRSGVVVQFWDSSGVVRKTSVSFTAL